MAFLRNEKLLHDYQDLLRSPLLKIAEDIPEVLPALPNLADGADPPIKTFFDMMRHPQPPMKLIEIVKYYAKRDYHMAHQLPSEVALTLYYLTLVQAYLMYGEKITAMSYEKLKSGITRLLEQTWLDPGTRTVFQRAVDEMELIPEAGGDPEASEFSPDIRFTAD